MNTFPDALIDWYENNKRDLPWRRDISAYRTWVSEIMLQQTRVESVLPYFERWMDHFPDVADLANASKQEVLGLWEGLGYYSRARNLHKAAKIIIKEHAGILPKDAEKLRALPGIGRYTAGAIASIAFGMDEPVVDGNVKRVMSRIFDIEESVDTSVGEKRVWSLAADNLPRGKASEYNQGLMELGARICKPRNPECEQCPIKQNCKSYQLGNQADRPVRKSKPDVPIKQMAAAVIVEGKSVWVRQRPEKGLLGGMWEFPSVEVEMGEDLEERFEDNLGFGVRKNSALGCFQHAYTHFRVEMSAYQFSLAGDVRQLKETKAGKWVSIRELDQYPMGKLDRQIAIKLTDKHKAKLPSG